MRHSLIPLTARWTFLAALVLVVASSVGCSTGRIAIEAGDADERTLAEIEHQLSDLESIPIPAETRFVSFLAGPLSVPPKSINLVTLSLPRRGATLEFPVSEAVKAALKKAVLAAFDPPDTRQKPLQSEHLDVEFRMTQARITHYGGAGECTADIRVDCILRLPSGYAIRRFPLKATVTSNMQVPRSETDANPLWKAAASLADQFYRQVHEENLKSELLRYRAVEHVCSKVGHKKGLEDEGDFCEIHGSAFVPRVELKK